MELKKRFINPYNFVKNSNKVVYVKSQNYNLSEKATGYAECYITVAEKLALPERKNTNSDNSKDAFYDFYKIDGKPIIPGSEIKGCIRSLYEALTFSCYSVVNTNILTQRPAMSKDNISNPCIVRYNKQEKKWYLYPANKNSNKTTNSIMRQWKAAPTNKDTKYTTQYYSSNFNDKEKIDCTDKIDDFKEIIRIFLKNNSSDKEFCQYINDLKNKVEKFYPFVAFFIFNGKEITYFSPAQISRMAFKHKVTDFLEEHSPCCGEQDEYCSGCRLFGTLGKNKPIASRLRFTDATPFKDTVHIGSTPDRMPPLSYPKLTSVEFYSSYGRQSRNVERWDYDTDGVELRGRKFYFHSIPKNENEKNFQELVTGQYRTACALRGSKFTFRVYFDSITKEELGKLLWVLALGDNRESSDYMQKIGAGKPVGYGSVKITVGDIVLRNAENYSITKAKYDELVSNEDVFDEIALKDIKNICNYNYLKDKYDLVSYPIGDNGKNKKTSKGSLQWFVINRPTDGKFKQVLPSLTDNANNLIMDSHICYNRSENNQCENNPRKYNNKPISLFSTDEFKLKCEICGKEDKVDNSTYKQRKNGGYKCKSCRGKK